MGKILWGDFKPMDIIGFSSCSGHGVGINLFSLGIPFYHCSHVAVVAFHPDHPWPLLCESTTLYPEPCVVQGKVLDGVQWHKIIPRIASYRGMVYHYRLREKLSPSAESQLSQFLVSITGREYDTWGALGARNTLLGALVRRGHKTDLSSLFCSEVVMSAGQKIGIYPKHALSSGYSPNQVIRRSVCEWRTHHRARWVKRYPCVWNRHVKSVN